MSEKAPVLLTAGPDDAPAVLQWIRRYYEHDGLRLDEMTAVPALRELLGDASLGRVWFILDGETERGYAIATFGFDLEFGGRLMTLTDLYLSPEARGRGLGSAALAACAVEARNLGAHALTLEVLRSNASAQAFYRKAGFQPLDRLPMDLRLDAEGGGWGTGK